MSETMFEKNLRIISGFQEIPDGWRAISIVDLCIVGRGRVISQEEIYRHPGRYPVFSSQTSNNGEMGCLDTFDFDGEWVTWTTDGANAGTVFYRSGRFNCTNVCGTLQPNSDDSLNLTFLKYQLGRIAKNYVSYIGNPKLMNDVMARVALILPPLPQQRKIARILTTLDNLIEKTEALIAKYQSIKQGMMADLFTRGVDANGKLRPPQSAAPELYKQSELGWIPKEWEVENLDEIIRIIDCKHFTPRFQSDGVPFIRPRNVKVDGLDFSDVEFVSPQDFRLLTDKHEPRPGDIVFSRNASFGVPCFINHDRKFAIGQDTVVMTTKHVNTKFVYYSLLSPACGDQVMRASTGSTFGRINLAFIRSLRICVPQNDEQIIITQKLDQLTIVTKNESTRLEKLQTLKAGLMQDLLTGKVPVKSDESEEVAANA